MHNVNQPDKNTKNPYRFIFFNASFSDINHYFYRAIVHEGGKMRRGSWRYQKV